MLTGDLCGLQVMDGCILYITSMVSVSAAVISVLFFFTSSVMSSYINKYDRPVTFQCPSGHSIYNIRSKHHNHYEDRMYDYSCRRTKGLGRCRWHAYVNSFDEPVLFQCPSDGVISGVSSYHSNHHEDRRFKFYCCDLKRNRLVSCEFSDYANFFDHPVNYRVHSGRVLKGVFSYHHNHYEDRRFKFETCKLH